MLWRLIHAAGQGGDCEIQNKFWQCDEHPHDVILMLAAQVLLFQLLVSFLIV